MKVSPKRLSKTRNLLSWRGSVVLRLVEKKKKKSRQAPAKEKEGLGSKGLP